MIIARGEDKETGEQLLLLGLSRENLKRLQEGAPMLITRKTHGDGIPENWRIVIIFGETELSMQRELDEFITPETKIHRDPRL
jgi:hypothetical protein